MAAALHVVALTLLSLFATAAQGQNTSPWNTIVTFNTALPGDNNFSAFYSERKEAFITSLRNDPVWRTADVVCLQEVVVSDDRSQIVSAAASVGLQYSVANLTVENATALGDANACNTSGLLSLTLCLNSQCGGIGNGSIQALLPCAVQNCISTLSQPCINCIINVGRASELSSCGARKAREHLSNLGLLLLSRKRILHSSLSAFSEQPDAFRRGYIRADIKDVGTVFCTHTYPFFDSFPPTHATNMRAEQANLQQIQELVLQASGHEAIITGDLNTSPSVPANGVNPIFNASFEALRNGGFNSPYAHHTSSACTFCSDNPILERESAASNGTLMYLSSILDHTIVNYRVFNVDHAQTMRVLDGNVVNVTAEDGSTTLKVPLSDHYGVQVRLQASAMTHICSAVLVWLIVLAGLCFQA